MDERGEKYTGEKKGFLLIHSDSSMEMYRFDPLSYSFFVLIFIVL